MDLWSVAVLEWVNCLDLLETNVDDLKELRDCKFYAKLIKILSQKEPENELDDKGFVMKFIQDTYPEFFAQIERNEGTCREIHVASLLMIHSSQEPKLHRPMCIKLSNDTQLKIKSFLEKVLQRGNDVTKDDINSAIMETTENIVKTPPATPRMRPLKDFLNSPITTVRKNYNRIMDERTREIRRLKAELETERFEKADLQEDLEIQRRKINNLQEKLQEKIADIEKIREESTKLETPQSCRKRKDLQTQKNRLSPKVQALTDKVVLLKSEISNLEEEKQVLIRKLASVERHCITLKERSEMNERNLETLLIQLDVKDGEIENLKMFNEELRTHIQETRRQTIEDQSFEMEMTAISSSNISSLNDSEVLSSVIDIQLQEAKEESKVFKLQLEDLQQKLQSVQEENRIVSHTNKSLEAELSSFQSTKQELFKVRKELTDCIEKIKTIEKESLHYQEESTKLRILLLSNEKLVEQSEQQNENLKIRLSDLENKLETANHLLNKENIKVKNLELVILQKDHEKAEILETELSKYKALDQKYIKLEQEKLDLIGKNEDLQKSVFSKENILQQAQQQKLELESAVQNFKSELRTVQDLLSSETKRVKDLQSQLSQMKLNHEETLEKQLLRYQNLEQEYASLEQEKLNLTNTIENLNNVILSKEELIKQLWEEKKNFDSTLYNLNEKCQTLEDLLDKEQTKVKDLESIIIQIKQEKEEALENQLRCYQILAEENVNLKQEKSNLLTDVEKFKNLISSKDELLKQSQQQNVKFESDLLKLKKNLENVQELLNKEKDTVKNLKTTARQIELAHEGTIQEQLLKYQELKNKFLILDQEKISSWEKIKDLTEKIVSNNDLLEQSRQQNESLSSNLQDLKDKLQAAQNSLTEEQTKVKNLETTLDDVKQEKVQVLNLQLLKYQELEEKYINLEQKKLGLLQKIEDLNQNIVSKEDLLKESRQKNEDLVLIIEDLKNKLAMSYQALEEKHRNLEKEKTSALKDIENLKSLLSSKVELLQQSQEQNAKLDLDLCDVKDKMKITQNELNTAIAEVKNLESVLVQTKFEMDKIVETESSKSEALQEFNENLHIKITELKSEKQDLLEVQEQLQKQNINIEQEKSRLMKEIEELKTQVSSRQASLEKIQQQNQNFQLKIGDLGEEIKFVENLASVKNIKVKDLESVIAEMERERKESLDIIEEFKLANTDHKNLIQSCSSILTDVIKHFSQLIGNQTTDVNDLTILDLSKQLKTLVYSVELILNTKDSDLENFKTTTDSLNLTVSKLNIDLAQFEEIKVKNDHMTSQYLKEIADLKEKETLLIKEKEILAEDMSNLEKTTSNEKLKINLLIEEKKSFGKNLLNLKQSLNLLKNEKLILLQNVKNQSKDVSNQIANLSETITKLQNQVCHDNFTIESLRKDNALLNSKYDEEKKMRSDLEIKYESLENNNKLQTKEKKELKDKLNAIRVRNAKLEKNLDELRKENKRFEMEKLTAEESSKLEELKICISKLELEKEKLEAEKNELSKRPTEQDFDSRLKEVHIEYAQKLEMLKLKMKSTYNEQIKKVNRDQERLLQEKLNMQKLKMEEQCRKHAEEITKYKDHVTKLSSEFWDVGEKLLVEKQQKEQLAHQLQDLKKRLQSERSSTLPHTASQQIPTTKSKSLSLDRREFVTNTRDDSSIRTVETIKEEFTKCTRRESIQSVQTMQGMGNAFKVEDEEGEVFNTNYLADMKAGRCSTIPDLDRLSVLQMRNAQCKPHLKSSYPAETQFQPGTFTEEEIKSGSTIEDIFNDSLSQSLLPGEKTKKRDRTQTLYKRPGPPTPSKNGGRLSLQGNETRSPNSRILRERNTDRRSTATPRRLKDLFGGNSRRQDENVSGTPKGRRLSSIFRKPK